MVTASLTRENISVSIWRKIFCSSKRTFSPKQIPNAPKKDGNLRPLRSTVLAQMIFHYSAKTILCLKNHILRRYIDIGEFINFSVPVNKRRGSKSASTEKQMRPVVRKTIVVPRRGGRNRHISFRGNDFQFTAKYLISRSSKKLVADGCDPISRQLSR